MTSPTTLTENFDAYFLAHAQKSFFPILNQGELAVLFCFVLLYLAVAGAGAWSLMKGIDTLT